MLPKPAEDGAAAGQGSRGAVDGANDRLLAHGSESLVATLGPIPPTLAQITTEIDADELREIAERILAERAYAESEPSVLSRIFDWLAELFDIDIPSPETGALDAGGAGLVGLRTALIVMVILALVGWGASYVIRQRTSLRPADHEAPISEAGWTVNEMERRASAAAKRGDFAEALRLRFEAGLVRLEKRGTLSRHTTRTSGQVGEAVRLREFDQVADVFDAVIYGGRPAASEDDAFSASAWPVIVAQAPKPEDQDQ